MPTKPLENTLCAEPAAVSTSVNGVSCLAVTEIFGCVVMVPVEMVARVPHEAGFVHDAVNVKVVGVGAAHTK